MTFFVQASVWDDEVHDGVVVARNVRVRFPNLGLMILLRPDAQARVREQTLWSCDTDLV